MTSDLLQTKFYVPRLWVSIVTRPCPTKHLSKWFCDSKQFTKWSVVIALLVTACEGNATLSPAVPAGPFSLGETWWLWGIALLLLAGVALGGFRLGIRNIRARNLELETQLSKQTKELSALNAIAEAINRSLELNKLFHLILQQATTLLQADGGIINLVDWERNEDLVVAATGSTAFTLGHRSSLEGSLSGWITIHDRPVISDPVQSDIRVDRRALPWIAEAQIESAAAAPLTVKDEVIGTLLVVGTRGGRGKFNQSDLSILVAFANQAAAAIERARLFTQSQQRMRELEALYRADEELYRHLSLEEVLQALVDIAVDMLDADKSSLMVWDEEQGRLVMRVARGFSPEAMASLSFALEEGTVGRAAANGEPVIVEDALTDPRRKDERPEAVEAVLSEGIRSFIHIPIRIEDELFGVFNVDFAEPHAFGDEELRLFTALAGRAAVAIKNSQLYEQTQELAVLEERRRLARELHDSVTQALYGVTLYAEAIERHLSAGQVELAADHLHELKNTAQEALREMRLLIFELRPQDLDKAGLVAVLQSRLEAVEARAGLETHFNVTGEIYLPAEIEESLYRIAQEALNNALKHSGARCVTVTLNLDQPTVVLEIADNGIGFDPSTAVEGGGLGLNGMIERANQIGGEIALESELGVGTKVRVEVKQ